MLSLFIFLIIITIFKADARSGDNDAQTIIFAITRMPFENPNKLICDHDLNDMQHKIYTVLEGEEFIIIPKYNADINYFTCSDCNNNETFNYKKGVLKNAATFKVEKIMGVVWNCTVLAHRDVEPSTMLPTVQYEKHKYSAAYCYMKIHVRQTNPLQTILVNNMVLQAVRTDLSEKDVDFIAEYQYADGDVVDVTCVNFLEPALLTMEYTMAGTKSDNSIMKELSSYNLIGFRAKLHSGHNNSYMICTNTESTDYTKVMVRFVMRAEFNIISIKINGLTLRPEIKTVENYYNEVEYKYKSHQLINVTCEVQKKGMKLIVVDKLADFVGEVSDYQKTEEIQKAVMSFYLNIMDNKKLQCSSDKIGGGVAEQVTISFTAGKLETAQYPLHMELPSNGTVMELFNDDTLRVIYYEFEDDETLQLKCGPLLGLTPGQLLPIYLQLNNSDECRRNGCVVSKTLHVTGDDDNSKIACYLKEQEGLLGPSIIDEVLREIRVIFLNRVRTTSSPTAANTNIAADPASRETSTNTLGYYMAAVGCAVFLVIIILYLSVKKRCCWTRSSSQGLPSVATPRPHPDTVFYQNLLPVFQPINEREAAELENQYEEIQ